MFSVLCVLRFLPLSIHSKEFYTFRPTVKVLFVLKTFKKNLLLSFVNASILLSVNIGILHTLVDFIVIMIHLTCMCFDTLFQCVYIFLMSQLTNI